MNKNQFAVLGLGRFGRSVAQTLYEMGNDVLAVDISEDAVQDMSNSVTHAVQADVTDDEVLRALGINHFNVAIVAIGDDIEASILATITAKELGVKTVIAKAQSEMHAKVLYKIGADKVVFPEREMGMKIAHSLSVSNILDYIEFMPEYGIMEISPLEGWANKKLKDLAVRERYGFTVLAIKTTKDDKTEINVAPKADDIIKENDIVVLVGRTDDLNKLKKR